MTDDHRDDEAIVELGRTGNIIEAQRLVAELEARGITAARLNDMRVVYGSALQDSRGTRVLVFENDVDAARRIARDIGIDL